mgnify:CR=1 FL=1
MENIIKGSGRGRSGQTAASRAKGTLKRVKSGKGRIGGGRGAAKGAGKGVKGAKIPKLGTKRNAGMQQILNAIARPNGAAAKSIMASQGVSASKLGRMSRSQKQTLADKIGRGTTAKGKATSASGKKSGTAAGKAKGAKGKASGRTRTKKG